MTHLVTKKEYVFGNVGCDKFVFFQKFVENSVGGDSKKGAAFEGACIKRVNGTRTAMHNALYSSIQ